MNSIKSILENLHLKLESFVSDSLLKKRSKITKFSASLTISLLCLVIAHYVYAKTHDYYTAILIFGTVLIYVYGGPFFGFLFSIILALLEDFLFISPIGEVLSTAEEGIRFVVFMIISSVTYILIASSRSSLIRTAVAKLEAERAKLNLEVELSNSAKREGRLQRILKGINDGYFEWNQETDEIFYSKQWSEFLGYSDAELANVGQTFFELFHPDDSIFVAKVLDHHFKSEFPFDISARIKCKCGEYKWFRSRGYATRDQNGKPILLSGAITDISDVKQRESELADINMSLNAAVHARDEMVGIISHELKNPLTALQTGMLLIQRNLPKDAGGYSASELITKLLKAIDRMNRLISDLLDVTKLEANAMKLTTRNCFLSLIVQEVINAQFALSLEKMVEIQSNISPDLKVPCDSDRISQVITNLISNSLKFTNAGGSIHITADKVGDQIEVKVADTGKGISKEHLSHVFDRFWQARDSAHQGTGLGLAIAIVRGIIEAHGGKVWAESELGIGSIFHFTLPVAQNESLSLPKQAAS